MHTVSLCFVLWWLDYEFLVDLQGSFCACAQPLRGEIILKHRLLLAKRIHKMTPWFLWSIHPLIVFYRWTNRLYRWTNPHLQKFAHSFVVFCCIQRAKCIWNVYTTSVLFGNQRLHTLWAPDGKVHGVNMGPIWGRQDPGGPLLASWILHQGDHENSCQINSENEQEVMSINSWLMLFMHRPDKLDVLIQCMHRNLHSYYEFVAGSV